MDKSTEIILSEIVSPLLISQVIPKLKHYFQANLGKRGDSKKIESCIDNYLQRRYEKYFIMETLAFPNRQIVFNSLYEPLTVVDCGRGQLSIFQYSRKNKEFKINGFSPKFLPTYYRILLEDSAGMGKSTISRKLFLSAIEECATIPILIELRNLSRENSIEKEIINQFFLNDHNLDKDIVLDFIYKGGFTFIFDGYDEISSSNKSIVTKDIHQFIERANYNQFLITSRPEDSLASFNSFYKFSIKPLELKEANKLIKKYDLFNYKPISKELLKHIKEEKNKAIKEYLTNPFLISLLYKSFDYKKDIPLKKSQFYCQVYDALFESHDLSKEGYYVRKKYSNLHKDDFERVIRYFAFLTSIENEIKYDENQILHLIEKVKKYLPDLDFKSSDYLKDLLETVPLFRRDGTDLKWAHKSLQDYFTAKFIWIDSQENQKSILRKIYDDLSNARFYNVLDIYIELDIKGFSCSILFWYLEAFESYYKGFCDKNPTIDEKIALEISQNAYNKHGVFYISKKYDINLSEEQRDELVMRSFLERHMEGMDKLKIKYRASEGGIAIFYFRESALCILISNYIKEGNVETISKLLSDKMDRYVKYRSHNFQPSNRVPKIFASDKTYVLDLDDKLSLDNNQNLNFIKVLTNNGLVLNGSEILRELENFRNKNKDQSEKNDFLNW